MVTLLDMVYEKVAFSPDGSLLAANVRDTVVLWRVDSFGR